MIVKAWLDYLTRVVPPNASGVQVTETRRAFYAGAAEMLKLVANAAGGPDTPDDAGVAALVAIQTELEEFLEQVKAGVA